MSPRATVRGIQKLSSNRATLCRYMIPKPTATLGDAVNALKVSDVLVPREFERVRYDVERMIAIIKRKNLPVFQGMSEPALTKACPRNGLSASLGKGVIKLRPVAQ